MQGIIISTMLFSCSQEENRCLESKNSQYSEVIKNVDEISIAFLSSQNTSDATRSIFSRLWNAVCADADVIWDWCHKHQSHGTQIPIQLTAAASKAAYYNILIKAPIYSEYSYDQQAILNKLATSYSPDPNNPTIAQLHNTVILQLIKEDQWEEETTYATVKKNDQNYRKFKSYYTSDNRL